MILNSQNIITVSLIVVFTLFSGAVANAQKPVQPDVSTVQLQDTAKVPALSPNYDDETEHTPLGNILPLSPQAASLARYGEYPVSHATGIPDITIPIYEIKLGDFTLPISISYHASGIKVDDVASTVGLGWTLNAGGAVTRQICGAPDLTNASQEYADYNRLVELRDKAHKDDTGTSMLRTLLYGTGGSNPYYPYDTQSDRYSYNFAGKSGMFRYSYGNGEFIPINYSRIKIYGDTDIEGGLFRMTDTDGIVYEFSEQEHCGVKNDENNTDVSAWYMTGVKTPYGDISIKYTNSSLYTTYTYSESVVTGVFDHGKYFSGGLYGRSEDSRFIGGRTEIIYKIPVVSEISWRGGSITFNYMNDRKDVWKTRLANISVYDMDGKQVRFVNFANRHFWGCDSTDMRMMLDSIFISNTGFYTFDYNDVNVCRMPKYKNAQCGQFLEQTSCEADYWGYWNGKKNKSSIPKEAYEMCLAKYPGARGNAGYSLDLFADRTPDDYYSRCGIIQRITYPTGGCTEFIFEGNDFQFGGLRVKFIKNYGGSCKNNIIEYVYSGSRQMTNHPLDMMVYDSFNLMYNDPDSMPEVCPFSDITCTGTPIFPLNSSMVFYTNVTEKYSDGSYTDFSYSCFPEPGDLCGYFTERPPQLMYQSLNDFGITSPFLTGKVVHDIEGKPVYEESNTYENKSLATFCAGIKIESFVRTSSPYGRCIYNDIGYGPYYVNSETIRFDSVVVHPFITRIISAKTTDYITGVTTIKAYTYDDASRTVKPRSISVENSDGKTHTTEYRYAFDFGDELHRRMTDDYNMYDAVVETRNSCEGMSMTVEQTEYTEKNDWIYPEIVSKSILGSTMFEKYRFDGYDNCGNLTRLVTNTCDVDSIVWGYNGMHPTEHLHNGSLVGKYLWKPLCGVSSLIKPNGQVINYGYDTAGRLSSVSDAWGIKQRFGYNYSNGIKDECIYDNTSNYVKTTNVLSADETCRNVSLQYVDGLGRPFDSATDASSENGKLVHSFSSYDGKGRVCRKWLPAISDDESKILSEQDFADISRNTYDDSMAYSDITYDALDRNVYESTPGTLWKDKGKGVEYIGNGDRDVRCFSSPFDKISLVDNGFYKPNMLYGEKTTDEDGHSLTIFTDKLGRKILERRNDGKNNNDTYFVYNDLGQLRYVLSPEYQNSGYKEKYAYEYRYDGRGNVVKKILPGCEYTQYWYDRGDRVSFFQNAALRDNGMYRFFLYDSLGRLAMQGVCNGCNRSEEVNTAEYKENVDGICYTGYVIPLSDKITNPDLETVNYYDNYTFLQRYSAELGSLVPDFQVKGNCALGLQTGKVQKASGGGKVIEVSFYDGKGQPVDIRRLQVGKRLTCTHTDYSYTGKPTKVIVDEYSVNGSGKTLVASQIIENVYSKKTDKLLSTSISVNGKKETTQRFEYDDMGRIKEVRRGGNAGAVSYDYNIQGWPTNIDSKDFHEELHYTDGVGTPCYNGNISSQLWSTSDYGQIRGYKFEYDGLDRLKEAVYGETPSLSDKQNRYNEKVIEYTANGAMKRFQRRGRKDDGEYGKIDNLHIKLNGNQLLSVADDALPANKYSSFNFIDVANETVEYEYNGVGALTKDLNRGMTIRYDNLDYPRHIEFNDGNSTTYSYLPDGTLLSREYGLKYIGRKGNSNGAIGIGSGTDSVTTDVPSFSDPQIAERPSLIVIGKTEYSGNIIYKNGKLDKVLFPGGYCTFDSENNSQPIFHYFTQDHLGNNRTVTNEDGTVEQITHYYPFGGTFNDAGVNASLQQYKYNGKELDRVAGLNTYDYGARQYFSALPTWDRMDALCEKYYNISPYAYCKNNPIKFIDLWGMFLGDYYDNKNNYIGSDGINDNEMYVLRTTNAYFDSYSEYGQRVKVTNISKKQAKAAIAEIQSHNGDSSYDFSHARNSFVRIDGTTETRRKVMSFIKDDGTGGDKPNNNREYLVYFDKQDQTDIGYRVGDIGNPDTDRDISIGYKGYDGMAYFHTHPSGYSSSGWAQPPSVQDISNGEKFNMYVIGMGNKTVYIYNKNEGIIASFSINTFLK